MKEGIIMSLIKCLECGKDISDKANTCPNCGFLVNKENKVKVYGYTQSFLINPNIKVYVNGEFFDIVKVGNVLEIPITEPMELKFKCYFRSAKVVVTDKESTKIKLTWNRITGKIIPQFVDYVINTH